MRISGFMPKSSAKARVRSLKAQFVFKKSGQINKFNNEWILTAQGRGWSGPSSILDTYQKSISRKKRKIL
jgi:hypothetical protein